MTFIVRLTGGLGNQMFQYALARSLAKKYNARLKLDISYYHNQPHKDTPRTFELNQLCIVDNILNSSSSVSYTHLTLPTNARPCVDLGGRRIIKKKNRQPKKNKGARSEENN
nr:hypothetical protein [Escherichia coli]